jgi:membrane fusion protein
MPSSQPLFRTEPLTQQQQKWLGEIVMIRPLSFTFFALFAAVIAVVILVFLVWGEYTRKARVDGYLVPTQGLIQVYAPLQGIIIESHVQDGQWVRKGQVLFVLYVERNSTQGATQTEVIKQLTLQEKSLREELLEKRLLQRKQESALKKHLSHLRDQLAQVEEELKTQVNRVRLSKASFKSFQKLYAEQYVSDLQLQEKEAAILDQKAQLHSLKRSKIALQKERSKTQAELNELPMKVRIELAEVGRNISEIKENIAEAAAQLEVVVPAPQGGTVTATMFKVGQVISEGIPLLSIIPSGTQLLAELYATSRAVGFVEPGNTVLLKYEAYPYQKFGTYKGIVTDISRSALRAKELPLPTDPAETYYRINVKLAKQAVLAYGKPQSLQPGMRLKADIMLDRRTLLEWMLDPLYSISGSLQ